MNIEIPAPHRRLGRQRRALRVVAGLCLALCTLGGMRHAAYAQNKPVKEYQLKAVFLFNFTQFVDWPPDAFADPQAPLVIGVLGDDPFGAYLDETVRGERVNGRPLVIRRYRQLDDLTPCHILFVSQSERARLDRVFDAVKSANVLTVSDIKDFDRRGGMIQFVTDHNKIRLHINLDATQTTKLTISSKLLRSATVSNSGGN